MRLVEQGEGMLNSNQGAPLGLLSMGHFLKHLPLGYPSSDEQRSRRRECSSETWGLWQWADMRQHLLRFSSPFFLSLHDQSDSRTGCCALTRTVFSACNKSMISTDDKRTQWWISVQVPQVHCTTSVISSVRSTEWSWEANVLNKNWNVS